MKAAAQIEQERGRRCHAQPLWRGLSLQSETCLLTSLSKQSTPTGSAILSLRKSAIKSDASHMSASAGTMDRVMPRNPFARIFIAAISAAIIMVAANVLTKAIAQAAYDSVWAGD